MSGGLVVARTTPVALAGGYTDAVVAAIGGTVTALSVNTAVVPSPSTMDIASSALVMLRRLLLRRTCRRLLAVGSSAAAGVALTLSFSRRASSSSSRVRFRLPMVFCNTHKSSTRRQTECPSTLLQSAITTRGRPAHSDSASKAMNSSSVSPKAGASPNPAIRRARSRR
jgi:hypothetical protein